MNDLRRKIEEILACAWQRGGFGYEKLDDLVDQIMSLLPTTKPYKEEYKLKV